MLTSPMFYMTVVDDPWFVPAVVGVLALYVVGVMTMRKIVAIKV